MKYYPDYKGTELQRFWSGIAFVGDCWQWVRTKTDKGYGHFRPKGRGPVRVHKWIWEQLNGPVPAGYEIHHRCENRACVNPAHLMVISHARNMALGKLAKATQCKRGHEFTAENTRKKGNHRFCRACDRIRSKAKYARKRKSIRDPQG